MNELDIQWSSQVPFELPAVEREVPDKAGVYEILQSETYSRYNRCTRILKIGLSKGSLRQELANHFVRHTTANRLARVRKRSGVQVSVVFAVLAQDLVLQKENELLRRFEDEHWELPLLNSQRGYARNADGHYRT
jgi:hypothetical protein